MASPDWRIRGDYFETCSCDYVCPCIPTNMAGKPTQGHCYAALVFHVEEGRFDGTTLDGLSFAVLLYTPEAMGKGDWSVGVVTDEAGDEAQQRALLAIAAGQAGGPMAPLGALIGNFLGTEAKPISYQRDGLGRSVSIPGLLDQAVEGVPSVSRQGEPLYVENVAHPANTRLALAQATRSHMHAFGLNWDDTSGHNNGHFAPFDWRAG